MPIKKKALPPKRKPQAHTAKAIAPNSATWPVELWPITRLIPYARNPRLIPEAAIAKVAGSVKAFGFQQPIVVDKEDVIVVGHTRLLAARRLGLTEVPVRIASDLSATAARAYRLADNRVATETSFDDGMLALEFADLQLEEFDLTLTGFEPIEIEKLSGTLAPEGAEENWKEMPGFHQDDLSPKQSIIVHFNGEDSRSDFARLVGQPITDKTRFIWHPKAAIGHYADKQYVSNGDIQS